MITPQEALIYTMVIVSGSDRDMTDAELRQIGRMVKSLPVFAAYKADRLTETARECAVILHAKNGLAHCLDQVAKSLTPRLRETAYLLACEMSAIDGEVHAEEAGILGMLRRALQIDHLAAAALERATSARLAPDPAA
jgi:tellurite resistance protein